MVLVLPVEVEKMAENGLTVNKCILIFILISTLMNNCTILYKPNNKLIASSKSFELNSVSFNFRAESLQEWTVNRDSLDTGFSTNYSFQQEGLNISLIKLSNEKAIRRSLFQSEKIHLEISQVKTYPRSLTVTEGLNAYFSSFTLFLAPTKITVELPIRFEVYKEKKYIKTYIYQQSYIMYMSSFFPIYFFNDSVETGKEIFDPIITNLLLDMQKDKLL